MIVNFWFHKYIHQKIATINGFSIYICDLHFTLHFSMHSFDKFKCKVLISKL